MHRTGRVLQPVCQRLRLFGLQLLQRQPLPTPSSQVGQCRLDLRRPRQPRRRLAGSPLWPSQHLHRARWRRGVGSTARCRHLRGSCRRPVFWAWVRAWQIRVRRTAFTGAHLAACRGPWFSMLRGFRLHNAAARTNAYTLQARSVHRWVTTCTTPHTGSAPTNPTASRGQYGNNITSTNPASDTPNQATGSTAQPQAWAHSFRLPARQPTGTAQADPQRARQVRFTPVCNAAPAPGTARAYRATTLRLQSTSSCLGLRRRPARAFCTGLRLPHPPGHQTQ